MSDWTREVEHASYSVQYTGPDSTESNPLLNGQARESRFTRIFWIMFLIILFGVGSAIGFYLLFKEEPQWPTNAPYVPISRQAWLAAPSIGDIPPLSSPITHVQITQTATDNCDNSPQCARMLRDIQAGHVSQRNLSDIAYNFIVGGDGRTYEGRGWNLQPGFVEKGEKEKTLVISFLGSFDYLPPPRAQVQEVKVLIQEGIKKKFLDKCFTISLFKERPQDGAGQMMRVFNKLTSEINKRKKIFKCV